MICGPGGCCGIPISPDGTRYLKSKHLNRGTYASYIHTAAHMLLMRKKASMFPNNWLTKKERKKAVIYQVYLNYEFEKFTDSYKHKKVSKYIKVNKSIYKIAISVFILINTMSVFSDFIMYYKRTLTLISTKVHQNQETLLLMCVDLTEKQSLYGDSSFSTLQTVSALVGLWSCL